MLERYEPEKFEAAWRKRWKDADLFLTRDEPGRPKFYGLDFFPYPSGAGLSVGHCRNYIPTDVLCRMKVMQGYNVLHPMGFDAFGLPAENEAIKNKTHPAKMIEQYAATYRRQMELIGISYDWSRAFSSSDPSFYRWTQWIFKLLYERGLAYRKNATVNWCPVDKTVLADEEVVGGRCWRCDSLVERKEIPQWFFKITAYAQRLIDDLDKVDWPEGIKQMQRNWIGRSEGVEFSMKVVFDEPSPEVETIEGSSIEWIKPDREPFIRVFTTRIDTIFGMTFCVLAPEHPMVETILGRVSAERRVAIEDYRRRVADLSDQDRLATTHEKSGVFTGAYAVNPANGKRVPIWIADYVLMGYGTGAIMAVPAHDERDFEFAETHDLGIVQVISDGGDIPLPFSLKDGALVNSGEYTGMPVLEAQRSLGEWIEALGIGERKVNYKLRDWLISRQRYWGSPIPVVYSAEGEEFLVPDSQLPVLLPNVDNYEPGCDGQSPLATIPEFVNCTDPDGRLGRRETDTMGGFACSSWYFLRFCDPYNDERAWDRDKVDSWMPVDCYVGGAEHAVMHLLYARFWTKVLYDAGLVSVDEPFQRLMNQGMLLAQTPYRHAREGEKLHVGEDGIQITFEEASKLPNDQVFLKWEKMSKSKGNVVTPDEAVDRFGADALRIYELFVAPFEQTVQWSEDGVQGAVRFLHRVFRLAAEIATHYDPDWRTKIVGTDIAGPMRDLRRSTHRTIAKATEDIERFAFNTYIAALMTHTNEIADATKAVPVPSEPEKFALSEALESLLLILSPAAPHSADQIWSELGLDGFTYCAKWPKFDAGLAKQDVLTVALQVNGKLRDTVVVAASADEETLRETALKSEKVQAHIDGKQVRKIVVVPGRLVNVVAN